MVVPDSLFWPVQFSICYREWGTEIPLRDTSLAHPDGLLTQMQRDPVAK